MTATVTKERTRATEATAPDAIRLGRYVEGREDSLPLRVLCDAPELEAHVCRPWFHAYAAERLDFPLKQDEETPTGNAIVTPDLLARHALLCGATGSGKTRLALHLLAEQLRIGCSVVMLDPKAETLRHLLQLAHGVGLQPQQVTVLSPFLAGAGAPGWNPLDGRATGMAPSQAAADLASVLQQSSGSWGPRMQDLLVNALIVVSAHGLSLWELARLLQREHYQSGLLMQEPPADCLRGDTIAYGEARDFFRQEFAAWGKAEKATAVAPVLNKFREMLRNPFLRSLLCARRSTLDIAGLWQRPGLVLVHLDGSALGDEGARLLGGMLAHQMLRTAMRVNGPTPVVLALDEVGVSQQFLGSALSGILAVARSRNLRLVTCCQHLAQLSGELRTALLANAAVQAFFRLGLEDARAAASSFAAGTGERVSVLSADVAKRDTDGNVEAWAETSHTVRDGWGEAVRLSPAAWTAFRDLSHKMTGAQQVEAVQRLACVSGVERLYVRTSGTGTPVELGCYLHGLGPDEFEVRGPAPVRVVVFFPKPRLSVVSKETEAERERGWVRTLTGLPVKRAALRLAGCRPSVAQVVSVPDPVSGGGSEHLLSAAVAANGQSAREVEEAIRWRQEQVERIATGKAERDRVEADKLDGRQATVKVHPPKALSDKVLEPHPLPAKAKAALPAVTRSDSSELPALMATELMIGDVGEDGSLV